MPSIHLWGRRAAATPALGLLPSCAPYLDAAVQAGIDSGVAFVVAAGNKYINSYRVSPAAITVAAPGASPRVPCRPA